MFGAQGGPADGQGFAGSRFPPCRVCCEECVANVPGMFQGINLCPEEPRLLPRLV